MEAGLRPGQEGAGVPVASLGLASRRKRGYSRARREVAMKISSRAQQIRPFHVMDILARAKALEAQGRDIVHMEVGEPDFDTAEPIVEAGRRALAEGALHYTAAVGIPELREAISRFYAEEYGVDVPARRILVTPGATGGLQLVLACLVDPDDEVLLTDPGYPCNRHYVLLLGGRPVAVPVDAAGGYQPTADQLAEAVTDRTVALLVASPANPTGAVLSSERLAELVAFARDRRLALVVDEIYHGLVYGETLDTVLAHSQEVFVVNSFSKYFGMTGWRLGWIVVPESFVETADRLAQNMFLCAPAVAQVAALAAFRPETRAVLEERRRAFRARRDFLVPALERLGFEVPVRPAGAFYVYARSDRVWPDSFELCRLLLEEAGVAATPGLDFGEHLAAAHVRFAYTTSLQRLELGVERIEHWLEGRRAAESVR